jgi:hypothetical protein
MVIETGSHMIFAAPRCQEDCSDMMAPRARRKAMTLDV